MDNEGVVKYWVEASEKEYAEKYLLQAEQFITWLKKHFQKI